MGEVGPKCHDFAYFYFVNDCILDIYVDNTGEVSRILSDLAHRVDICMLNGCHYLSIIPNSRVTVERSRPNVLDICGIPVRKQWETY